MAKLISSALPSSVSPYYHSLNPNQVAAFPSMHAAYPLLGALALWRISRAGAVVALAWSVLVWFSVVYLGEHYAVDVLGGIVVAVVTWLVLTRLVAPRVGALRTPSRRVTPERGRQAPARRSRRLPDPQGEATSLRVPTGLSAAEVHAHTTASDGMVSPAELVAAAAAIGLAVLCITDHDTMNGVDAAVEAGHRLGVEVVGGQEITCAFPANTHVVGLFHDRPVRMGMSLADTVDAVHDHGGLAILAHPFMPTFFASAGPRRIRELLRHRRVDGVELRHRAPMGPGGWDRLDAFYAAHREGLGAALGAGDSHFGPHDLGRLVTVFPGHTAADLRGAIQARATSPLAGPRPAPPSLSLRLRQQQRSLVWLSGERRAGRVGGGAGPRSAGG